MDLTVKELNNDKKEKVKMNHELYKKFLNVCYNRIRLRHKMGYYNMTYNVPPFVMGHFLYNYNHAMKYIIKKLTKGGFTVNHLHDNVIYIDWNAPEKPKRKK
jgi:hypothetical protein